MMMDIGLPGLPFNMGIRWGYPFQFLHFYRSMNIAEAGFKVTSEYILRRIRRIKKIMSPKKEIVTNSTEILHILILNCDPGEERCTTILFVKTNVYI